MRILVAVAVALVLGAIWTSDLSAQEAKAAAGAPQSAAQGAAEAWLALVDAERYDESWSAAGATFRAAVTAEAWRQQLSAGRSQVGGVASRSLQSAETASNPPNAPAGEYVFLTYASVFANVPAAREVVAVVKEEGNWRVVGYFIQPPQGM